MRSAAWHRRAALPSEALGARAPSADASPARPARSHYEPATAPGVLSARKQRLAAVRRVHRTWPVMPVVRPNSTVPNWAQILGDGNPPCVLTT